jgi:hypothetical protein
MEGKRRLGIGMHDTHGNFVLELAATSTERFCGLRNVKLLFRPI